MKILIIQQKMIGDVLTSSLLFEALRAKFPHAELHYLIEKSTAAVVLDNPFIDKIIYNRQDVSGNNVSFITFMSYIRKQQYNAVVDAYSKIGSALLTYASGAAIGVGRKKWYTFYLYSKTISYDDTKQTPRGKAIQFRMDLLKPLGVNTEAYYRPKVSLTPKEREEARGFMQKNEVDFKKPIIMCSVMGSNPQKTYPFPYFAEVLHFVVLQTNAQLLFNYLPSQEEAIKQLLQLCSPEVKKNVILSCYAKSLRQFIAITSYCNALIGNEGGAVHMAKAVNVPTFAIFSPQIKKEAWASNNINEVAVHLEDYKPELFNDLDNRKKILKVSDSLYEAFKPELFKTKLDNFLKATLG